MNQLNKKDFDKPGLKISGRLLSLIGTLYSYGNLAVLLLMIVFFIRLAKRTGSQLPLKFIILVFAGTWIFHRLIIFKIPTVSTFKLSRKKNPALYQMLDELSQNLELKENIDVSVDNSTEIKLQLIPSFGLIGPRHIVMTIGLPVWLAMTRNEIKAALAFQLSQISPKIDRGLASLMRAQIEWTIFNEHFLQLSGPLIKLHQIFSGWYCQVLSEQTSRRQEEIDQQRDRVAALMTTPAVFCMGLMRQRLFELKLEYEFWPEIWKLTAQNNQPVDFMFTTMKNFFSKEMSYAKAEYFLTTLLEESMIQCSPQRSIQGRLRSVGFEYQLIKVVKDLRHSLAEGERGTELIESQLDFLLDYFSKSWTALNRAKWARHHQSHKIAMGRLQEIIRMPKPTEEMISEKISLLLDWKSTDELVLQLERDVPHWPNKADLHFHIGLGYLELGSARGLLHLAEAVKLDDYYESESLQAQKAYYQNQKNEVESNRISTEQTSVHKKKSISDQERGSLSIHDQIEFVLPSSEIRRLMLDLLSPFSHFKEAYSVRKKTVSFPRHECRQLIIVLKAFNSEVEYFETKRRLANTFNSYAQLRRQFNILILSDRNSQLIQFLKSKRAQLSF